MKSKAKTMAEKVGPLTRAEWRALAVRLRAMANELGVAVRKAKPARRKAVAA